MRTIEKSLITIVSVIFVVLIIYNSGLIPQPIACTADALICHGGSSVGRVPPDCRFAPCPNCTCPEGFIQDGETCNPECYYSTPRCLAPSISCSSTCSSDSDCTGAECCHPTSCINKAYKGVCTELCTQVCQGPLDCGAGSCSCIDNRCVVISMKTYCKQDSDCACGISKETGECFYGNKAFVDTSRQCPDFCTGIAGNLVIKCVDDTCKQLQIG